ncbi:MAG: Na+/H+ antiporter NhaA [Pseudomonadota bacterium]
MEAPQVPESSSSGMYHAPWEKAFAKIVTPFEEFIHRQTTTGLILMATTIVALIMANTRFAPTYQAIVESYAGISVGSWSLNMSLHHWVNDGLMAFFFFVVGLELKREILVGELAQPRQAVLPIAAAVGGMLVPALLYVMINRGGGGLDGWGIPMATDIAFAIGVLVLLAKRVPPALITFLVALAIVDDLGAVLVIAIFYTDDIAVLWLLVSAALFGVLLLMNMIGVIKILPYFVVAVVLWYALFRSGIHATLAGVLGAFSVPARPKYDPDLFSRNVKKLLQRFDASYRSNNNILLNENLQAEVHTLDNGLRSVQPPLQRLEHMWHLPVAILVIPIFALFNAGIPLQLDTFKEALLHPVAIGVAVGLIVGKFVGITGSVWLALKLGVGQLPKDTSFRQIIGVSFLAGIGFTMATFIAELGFANDPDNLLMAKMGILFSSVVAGLIGTLWLVLCPQKHGELLSKHPID